MLLTRLTPFTRPIIFSVSCLLLAVSTSAQIASHKIGVQDASIRYTGSWTLIDRSHLTDGAANPGTVSAPLDSSSVTITFTGKPFAPTTSTRTHPYPSTDYAVCVYLQRQYAGVQVKVQVFDETSGAYWFRVDARNAWIGEPLVAHNSNTEKPHPEYAVSYTMYTSPMLEQAEHTLEIRTPRSKDASVQLFLAAFIVYSDTSPTSPSTAITTSTSASPPSTTSTSPSSSTSVHATTAVIQSEPLSSFVTTYKSSSTSTSAPSTDMPSTPAPGITVQPPNASNQENQNGSDPWSIGAKIGTAFGVITCLIGIITAIYKLGKWRGWWGENNKNIALSSPPPSPLSP